MKIRFMAACLLTTILVAFTSQPLNAEANGSSWREYIDSIADKDKLTESRSELGNMNTEIKTASLSQAHSSSVIKFDVEWKAGTVHIITTNRATIKITQKGFSNRNKKVPFTYTLDNGKIIIRDGREKVEQFQMKLRGGTIKISPVEGNQIMNDLVSKNYKAYLKEVLYDLIIEVPQRQYEKLEFNSEYASCNPKNIKINEVKSNSDSGIVQYENATFRKASGETVNGSINLIDCTAGDLNLDAVNGDLWVENSSVTDMKLEVVNGDILVNKKLSSGECTLSAVNGDVIVAPNQIASFSSKFRASVTNGDITLLLPANKGFYIPKRNIGYVGDIDSEFTLKLEKNNYVYGDGKQLLNVSCSNGDIAIYRVDK